jgi:zinc protease
MRQARAEYGSIVAQLTASPGGPITMSALRDMLDDDARFGVANYDEFTARNLGELRAWLDPQLQEGPIEVSLVGDVPWEQAQDAVASTLGALGKRARVAEQTPKVPAVFGPVGSVVRLSPISPNVAQIAAAWYWPVPIVTDIPLERRCYVLAAVLAERLRVKLREELGATYAPMVSFTRTDGFPNLNFFVFYAEIEPARSRQVYNLLLREARDLSENGPTADEFERAKLPYIRSMTDDLRTNSYWGGTVLEDAQQRPSRIVAARNRATDIASITRGELAALARRYLAPERAYKYATTHEAKR